MGQVHRSVVVIALLAAACSDDAASAPEPTCKVGSRSNAGPSLKVERFAAQPNDGVRHATVQDGERFVVDAKTPYADAVAAGAGTTFATRRTDTGFDVVRIAGADVTAIATVAAAACLDCALPIAIALDGRLLVGAPDSLLAFDRRGGTPATIASGFSAPRTIAVDTVTRETWLVDRTPTADVIHRVRTNVSRIDAPGTPLPARVDGVGVVVRDGLSWNLEGRFIYTANGSLVVVDANGPSGPAFSTTILFTEGAIVGVDAKGSAVVATTDGLAILADTAAAPLPESLVATGCLDPASAVAYAVASPLWSDGAEKQRVVVLPPGGEPRVLADGDVKLPVGTVAIKTFARDGKRIETRLFVQHALDDWVGYSYAWNSAGTDADLVKGRIVRDGWYFPSSADCNACHTPAAGFTLGIEARQLDDAAKAKLAPASSAARLSKDDARAYLHANCSMCHREGSATGLAELDLRFDTPLDRTGVCNEPKVGPIGITDRPRIVAPGAPERSVLVKRMRALDETRMPKLATHVVDEAGVALVESWVRSLSSCP